MIDLEVLLGFLVYYCEVALALTCINEQILPSTDPAFNQLRLRSPTSPDTPSTNLPAHRATMNPLDCKTTYNPMVAAGLEQIAFICSTLLDVATSYKHHKAQQIVSF